ncbi:MAG: hypothetical protein ACFFCV_00020 [Promethearchaeota archaeon]
MFALLFFYKAFDKYRNKPFFLNKSNNLTARIHVLFIISILSFISTPIFIIISGFGSFYHLPVISYSILYCIVYYYYHFQPIDFFDLSKEEFKHAGSFNLIAKQPYNFFVGINHIVHIIFLTFTAYTNFSWLFALTTNLIFYFILLRWTKSQVKNINKSISEKVPVLKELTVFKRKFVVSIIGLIFFLMIQMPFVIIVIFSLSGVRYSSLDIINNSFLTIIFILFYFKSSFYVNYYYGSKFDLYDKPGKLAESAETTPSLSIKYQKYNSYMSIILILLITLFSFLIQIPLLMIFILPFIYILLHYEQKYNLCSKRYNKSVVLLNSIALLIYISFGIFLPAIETILLNFLAFCISLYIVLQVFVKFEYFSKENVLIVQNLLAVASFTLLVYSFFPIIVDYISYTDPILNLISNILLHSLILSLVFLISQYIMGVRYFYGKSPKLYRVVVLINSFLVELFIFIFILFRIYFLSELITFLQSILLSSILFPIFFIFFLYINYGLHVFPLKYFLKSCYFTLWIFLVDFFTSLLILSLSTTYYIIIPIDCIFTSILYYFISKFGFKMERIDENRFKKRVKINSYLLTIELFSLFSLLFFSAFRAFSLFENVIYSTYLSLAIVCGLINLFSKKEIFSEDLYIKINTFFLLYTSLIAFYYFLLLTRNIRFVYIIPLMVSSIIFYVPILYLRKKNLYPKFISKSIIINSILLSTTISLIPTITGLELYFLGMYSDIIFLVMTVINFTFYILLTISTIVYNVLKKPDTIEERAKQIQKLQMLILFCLGATTVFYYPYFLLYNFIQYNIVIPLICTSCFLYIPLNISYKNKIFNLKHITKIIILNTLFLTGLVTLIPVIIGRDLLWLGLVDDYNIFVLNILNSSIYVFYIFLLILINISKKFKIKVKYILNLNRLRIILLFCISVTTIFCYPFFLLINTLHGIFISIISLLFSWFFLFYYSYKQEYFNLEFVKKITIYNFIAFSLLIISLPTIIALELTRIGLRADIILTITITSFLLFSFLRISEAVSEKIKLKEKYVKKFKLIGLISWFLFSLFISYYIASIFILELVFTPLTNLVLACSFFIFFILSIYTTNLISKTFPEYSKIKYFQDLIIYGIIISISSIFTFLGLSSGLFSFLIWWPSLLAISFLIGFFLAIFIILLNALDKQFQLSQTKTVSKLVSWLTIKIIICLSIISLIEFLGFSYSIINSIFLFCLTFTFFTPISLYILENLRYISSEKQILLKRITLTTFIVSILTVYVEFLYYSIYIIPIFYLNLFIMITAIAVNILLFLYYYSLRINRIIEAKSVFDLYKVYFPSFFLFLSLLYFDSVFSIFLILITYSLILSRRSILPSIRFLSYFLLSYYTFIEIIIILSSYGIIAGFEIAMTGLYFIIYLSSMSGILIFSILLHTKKNNNLEKFALYALVSLLSFVSLMTYTNILLLYNITISLFEVLLFLGIFFYHQKDERYKWFIKPCIILFVFDLISFLSYSWLFNNQVFLVYSSILTFTLTLTVTTLAFILIYNSSPARFRKRSFFIALSSLISSFPTFLYFIIIASLSMPIFSIVPLIFSIDIGVLLFYLSIGIYQWKISWAIWKSGWYAWNILPFVNFFLIYQSLTGIDVYTRSLPVFNASGSFILSIIICSLFFFPVVYTKIKKYFSTIVFIIWGESLFLLYWASFNLFTTDLWLRNFSFILFSVVLLIPLLIAFKYWKLVSILWIFPLTVINTIFLFFYLLSIGISLGMTISLVILAIGLFFMVYSFFPNIRSIGVILISAYFTTLLGIFLTVYFILYLILLNPIFSINLSFLVVGFSLFSSKYVEVPKRLIDMCLSWILIFNLSWFTFNTFNLFPGLFLFALSLAITVFGCSFFIFNRYKMKISLNKIFPFLMVALGTSSSITSLIYSIFNTSPGILISIFSSVFIIFLYYIFIEYRYFLWFLIPIPIATLILEGMLTIEVIEPFWLLTWAMLYLFSFQIIFNLFKKSIKKEPQEIKNSIFKLYQDENQVNLLNLTCFFLNSIIFSLFIAIIIPQLLPYLVFSHILFVYQICDFLIIWPILFLICMKYIEKSKLDIKVKDILQLFNKISSILYILIPIAVSTNLLLYMILINSSLTSSIYTLILMISGLIFIEVSIIDRNVLHFLLDATQNLFTLSSWIILSNGFSLFLFLFHSNLFLLILMISLLGLISFHFLSKFDVSKQIISKGRLILIYNSFIWSSLYLASLISDLLVQVFEGLIGFPYFSLLFQNTSILLFILSVIFVKIEKNLKNRIEFILFIIFQGLLAINLIFIFYIYAILHFLSINFVIFIEVCLMFIFVYYFDIIFAKQKYPNFKLKMHSILILILYCEISIMSYGLLYAVIGIYESLIVALSILLILTMLDIYSFKKIKIGYARLIHTISFFTISIMILLLIFSFIFQFPFLLGLGIFILVIMQFYTNYSLFKSLEEIFPKGQNTYKEAQLIIQQLLGTVFYGTICLFLAQVLIFYNVDFLLILLILSLIIHGLMIIDKISFKFLREIANYIQTISWISIMTFTSTYFIWLFYTYFGTFFYRAIPIIVIILLLEFAYLIKLLAFWKFVATYKEKIKFLLVIIAYLNFITWPLYFASLNPFHLLNLVLASFSIMFFLSLIDRTLKIRSRESLRSYSFLIVGILLSIDLFIIFLLNVGLNVFLSFSISSLIFVIFLGIIIKPFKGHSAGALIFWIVIFLLLSVIIYNVSLSLIAAGIFFAFTILIYPFVFLLEELKELINKIVGIITRFFTHLKIVIKNMFIRMFILFKKYFKFIWILICAIIASFCGILFSDLILGLLNPYHSILLVFPVFGILFSLKPSEKTEDVDIMFRRRMLRLVTSWGSIIIILFSFMFVQNVEPYWYALAVWISIWILGAILLPYIIFKERRENISIKWRFYTLIILISMLILFGIIVALQFYLNA